MYVPVMVYLVVQGSWTPVALLFAVGAGVLSSVIPYACDLVALRSVPPRFFGVLMSVHPVFAALAGWCCWVRFSMCTSGWGSRWWWR
jgi:inner membrane transporter RhtA